MATTPPPSNLFVAIYGSVLNTSHTTMRVMYEIIILRLEQRRENI